MIYVLLFIELALLIFSYIIQKNDVFSPSVLMTFMFFVSTVFALYFKEQTEQFQLKTVAIISSGLMAAILFDRVFLYQNKVKIVDKDEEKIETLHVDTIFLSIIVVLSVVSVTLFFADVVKVVKGYGYDLDSLFSTYRLIKINRLESLTGETPTTGFVANQAYRFLWAAGYVSSLYIAKNLNANDKFHQFGFHIVIIALALSLGLIEGARGGCLQLLSAFVFDYFVFLKKKKGWRKNIILYISVLVGVGVLCGIPLFYLSSVIGGSVGNKDIIGYISFYVGGSIVLLNMYVLNPMTTAPIVFGQETFVGILNNLSRLGCPIPAQDVHLEFRSIIEDYNANIYTFFRRPLNDFGFVGMLICVIVTICVFSWIYHQKIQYYTGSNPDYWILAYSLVVYWIIVSSMENYLTSISIGLVLNIIITLLLLHLYKNMTFQIILQILKNNWHK